MRLSKSPASAVSELQALALVAVLVSAGLPIAALIAEGPDNVLLMVQPGLYGQIVGQLDRLATELGNEGYEVDVSVGIWPDAAALRREMADAWRGRGLAGCIIFGDMPAARYEMDRDPTIGGGASAFPIDLYFEDLDGEWLDGDSDGALDGHEAGSGDLAPEIWLGRISLRTGGARESDLINSYIERDVAYRRGELSFPEASLLYLDDDWTKDLYASKHGLSHAYDRTMVVSGTRVTNASDYADRLGDGYEWVQVHTHVSLDGGSHAFSMDDDADNDGDGAADEADEGGTFGPQQMRNSTMASGFYNVFTCAAANYTRQDYLCGWYALGAGSGLGAIGSTKEGAMLNFDAFYGPLGRGASIGESFKRWMSATAEDYFGPDARNVSRAWFYGMTVIGDPTLALHEIDVNLGIVESSFAALAAAPAPLVLLARYKHI
jgi:hypothetical protein